MGRNAKGDVQHMIYPHPLPIPPDAKRIIILSNVTEGFSVADIGLQEKDVCIHINRAVHAEEAMAVPGTYHILMVRHGKDKENGGWKWFAPDTIRGYYHVLFTPVHDSFATLPWWKAYASATHGKVPSTGFMAYKTVKGEAPHLPVILAGFDPGVDHGTPMFAGHAWNYEALYYEKNGVTIIRPK